MYLPLMARLTVVSCTPTASAICTIVIGFNCEEPQPKAEGKPRYELPVVVLVLVRFGLITYEFMARTRPYAIVLIFILATIITPTPDVLTLIAMSLPMIVLYESCIWIAWFMKRRQTRAA